MSTDLRWDQCCSVVTEGKRCTKPATELGGMCGAHWRGCLPSTRDLHTWEATWAVDIPDPDVLPTTAIPSGWDIVRVAEAMLGD